MAEILMEAMAKHSLNHTREPILYRRDASESENWEEVPDTSSLGIALAAGCNHFVLDLGRIDASITVGTPFKIQDAWIDLAFLGDHWASTPRLDPEDLPHELYIKEDGGRVDEQKMDERVQKLNETILSIVKLVMSEVNLSSQGPGP